MFGDSGEQFGTNFITIVKRPDEICKGTGGVSES
jgi:hypothetical protein